MKNIFKLEHQYQLYLQRVDLKEENMSKEQRKQLRQTFMAACGQLIILLRDDMAELPEDEGVEIMESMLNEIGDYFLTISGKAN